MPTRIETIGAPSDPSDRDRAASQLADAEREFERQVAASDDDQRLLGRPPLDLGPIADKARLRLARRREAVERWGESSR